MISESRQSMRSKTLFGLDRVRWRSGMAVLAGWLLLLASALRAADASSATTPRFEVSIKPGLIDSPKAGRLFLILSRNETAEPRLALGKTGPEAPITLARDLKAFDPSNPALVDEKAYI